MSLKTIAAKIFAHRIAKRTNKWVNNPIETQEKVFKSLIAKGAETKFGKDHNFKTIKKHSDFIAQVPVRDYEELRSYVNLAVEGQENILWPGKPLYFAKTSGTTSGAKYIP
ncbi:GH3 family domain-containing protein, partial [Maribacter dokdonensis]